MSSAQYLYRRESGTYYVRLCVPARLKAAVGHGEIHRTTGCRDFRLAKIVAAELAIYWHRAIQSLDRMDIKKIKAGSIKLLGDGFVTLVEASNALGTSPLILAKQLIAKQAPFSVEAIKWTGWPVADIYQALDHNYDEAGQLEVVLDAEKLGGLQAQTKFSGRLLLRFHEEVLAVIGAEAPIGVCQFMTGASPDRGFICDLPGQLISTPMLEIRKIDVEAIRLNLSAQVTPEMEAAARVTTQVAADDDRHKAKPSLKFSEFMLEFFKRRCGHLKFDQLRRRKDQGDIFLDLMGDMPLASIDRATLRHFSDLIKKIPDERHNVRRRFKCPGADFNELIRLAELHALPCLTINAQHRLLDGYSEIFEWARVEGMIEKNPATGLGAEVVRDSGQPLVKQQDQRDPLSKDDLNKVFAADWFANGTGKRTPKGEFYAYRPHYYWLPLLALFNGGRLNELSQLYLSDIKEIEGFACIDFNLMGQDKVDIDETSAAPVVAKDKSLKTINAVRVVPIHQKILDLGFLQYVDALRKEGRSRLFPELKHDKTKGYGRAAGKWFNERYLGIVKVDLKSDLFSYTVDEDALKQAELMDGKLLLVTNVADLTPPEVVKRYKALADIERGFRVLKSEIEIAPVYHRLPERIRAHAFVSFLALIVYRVMRQRLKLAKSDLSPERALAELTLPPKNVLLS